MSDDADLALDDLVRNVRAFEPPLSRERADAMWASIAAELPAEPRRARRTAWPPWVLAAALALCVADPGGTRAPTAEVTAARAMAPVAHGQVARPRFEVRPTLAPHPPSPSREDPPVLAPHPPSLDGSAARDGAGLVARSPERPTAPVRLARAPRAPRSPPLAPTPSLAGSASRDVASLAGSASRDMASLAGSASRDVASLAGSASRDVASLAGSASRDVASLAGYASRDVASLAVPPAATCTPDARELMRTGAPDEAAAALEARLATAPDDVAARFDLARLYANHLARPRDAGLHLRALLAARPDDPTAPSLFRELCRVARVGGWHEPLCPERAAAP